MPNGEDIISRLREAFPDLPLAALRWLSKHPEAIQWPEDVAERRAITEEREATAGSFWQWVEKTYTPSQLQSIKSEDYDYTRIWEHYILKIVGTQWDVGFQQPGAVLQDQLQARIDTGEITRVEAADLWNKEQAMADSRARAEAGRREEFALFATGQKEFPEDRARRLERETGEETRLRMKQYTAFMRGRYAPRSGERPPEPFTEFGTAEEFRTGFDVPQTEQAISWFRSRFPRLIEQFQAKPKEEQIAQTWQELLKKRKPELREQFARLSPFQRGQRPGAFAPRITTVGF